MKNKFLKSVIIISAVLFLNACGDNTSDVNSGFKGYWKNTGNFGAIHIDGSGDEYSILFVTLHGNEKPNTIRKPLKVGTDGLYFEIRELDTIRPLKLAKGGNALQFGPESYVRTDEANIEEIRRKNTR